MAGYKFTWNRPKLSKTKDNSKKATLALGFATANMAMKGAPVLTGALVNSIRVTDDSEGKIYILAGGKVGGKNIPYAKRREYENKAHPEKKEYMKKAFKWAEENYKKYYEGVTQ